MSRNVTFYLGKGGTHLASRELVITRHMRAGDDSAPSAAYDNAAIGNTTETVTVALADNTLWQAVLTDTEVGGAESTPDILNFHTGSLQFPGPGTGDRLSILSMEDLSSSSSESSSISTSESSISTSSNSSSLSSSSPSSGSSSSQSSSSASSGSSSSSISTSSASSSSVSSESSSSWSSPV